MALNLELTWNDLATIKYDDDEIIVSKSNFKSENSSFSDMDYGRGKPLFRAMITIRGFDGKEYTLEYYGDSPEIALIKLLNTT